MAGASDTTRGSALGEGARSMGALRRRANAKSPRASATSAAVSASSVLGRAVAFERSDSGLVGTGALMGGGSTRGAAVFLVDQAQAIEREIRTELVHADGVGRDQGRKTAGGDDVARIA